MQAVPSQKVGHMKFAIIAIAVVLGVIRPFLSPHPVSLQGSYEALAHLYVGGVVGAWLVTRARWLLGIGIGLTVVEVASAVVSSFMH
jgi:hypothetical protein